MTLDQRQRDFVCHLLSLAQEGREDRGALADLRSGLGREPGQMARVHRHVVPYLPDDKRYNDRWYYLTATLFGLYPKHRSGYSLGRAFRPPKANSDSTERRFTALLNADADDLGGHLRHVVSLLKSGEQPLDWHRLLGDLLQWSHPEGHVQLRWARDFYQQDYKQDNNSSTEKSVEEEEKDHE